MTKYRYTAKQMILVHIDSDVPLCPGEIERRFHTNVAKGICNRRRVTSELIK